MVKVGGDLSVRSIALDKKLFDYVKIYGLLIEIDTETADVMEMKMDFLKRESTIVKSDRRLDMSESFERLMYCSVYLYFLEKIFQYIQEITLTHIDLEMNINCK